MESESEFKLLSENEIYEVLKNALVCDRSEIDLVNFTLIPVSNPEILGLLGEYFHLVIYAKIGNNLQSNKLEYFVKSVPITDELQSKLIRNYDFFPKETGMYSTIFKDLDKYGTKKWHAKCYYVRPDIIILEDLRKLNYRHLRDDEIFSIDHLKIVLKSLAALHANSIIFEEKTGEVIGEKYRCNLQEAQLFLGNGWFEAGVRAVQAVAYTIPKFYTNEVKKFLDEDYVKCIPAIIKIVEPSKTYRNVLCHRDLWVKNILFKYDHANPVKPVDCVFVDFQVSCYSPPALDVLQSIYLNSNRKIRNNCMNELLQFYYDSLRSELGTANINVEKHITWDEFLRSCEDVKLVSLMLSGIYTQLGNLPAGYLLDFREKDSAGYNFCVINDRSQFVLERMKELSSYKERMLECTEEIVDYIIKLDLH